MSTRANIHFINKYSDGESMAANIYRHSDGYPSGLGADLHRFLDEAAKLDDNRFSDAEYLAAKFLVWQAHEYATDYKGNEKGRLDFLSVAPCIKDHGDIEYQYKVICSCGRFGDNDARPKVFVTPCSGDWTEIKNQKQAESMK